MKNKECFVICPLGDEKSDIRKRSDSLYENVFKPAIVKANLNPIRSDESLTPTITPDILNRLRNASFVFADISGKSSPNPNVMYELGYREAFGLPSIIVRDENSPIPFDIKDKRIITISKPDSWSGPKELIIQLSERITFLLNYDNDLLIEPRPKVKIIDTSEKSKGYPKFYEVFSDYLRQSKERVTLIGEGFHCIDKKGINLAEKYLRVLTGCALRHRLDRIELANKNMTKWINLVSRYLAPLPNVYLYIPNPKMKNMFMLKNLCLIDPQLDKAVVEMMVSMQLNDPVIKDDVYITGTSLFIESKTIAKDWGDRIHRLIQKEIIIHVTISEFRKIYDLPSLDNYKNSDFCYYFAYGSNLLSEQMNVRVNSVLKICNAYLDGYEITFNIKGTLYDDAVANIIEADKRVWGVLYKVSKEEFEDKMDFYEGVRQNEYERIEVIVYSEKQEKFNAYTYINKNANLTNYPSISYLDRIIQGAESNSLPLPYIQSLKEMGK